MISKDDLYRLIQSMSKSEKRYFKLDTKKSGEQTNYLRLFDAINDMADYDEDKLKKKFQGEKFIKHLSQEKKYLYEAILRSMRNYNSDKSSLAQIKESLLDARYLYDRGLYDQSGKILKKVKKTATQFEDYLALLEIIKVELQLVNESQRKTVEEEIETLIKEKDEILLLVQEEFKHLDIYYRLFTKVAQKFELKDENNHKQLEAIAPFESLASQNPPQSKTAQRRLYQSLANYYQLIGNYDKSHEYHYKVVEWWDDNLESRGEQSYRYLIDLSNYLQTSFYLGKTEHVSRLLEQLDKGKPQNFREESVIFQKVTMNRLLYHLNHNEFDQALALVPTIETGLGKYKVNSTSRLVLTINTSILFFVKGQYENCKRWIEKITKMSKSKNRQDLQCLARLLYLVAQYELGEIDTLDSNFRAVQRFFVGNSKLGKDSFELNALSHLKKIFNVPPSELNDVLIEFKSYMEEPDNTSNTKMKYPGLNELLLWVDSKLTKTPMTQMLIADQK